MVKLNEAALDTAFAALADPTRRAMLKRLSKSDCTVGELAEPFDMSLPAVSKHVHVLERAGLLKQVKRGRERWCHLDPRPLKKTHQWVSFYEKFWSRQLDSLAAFLEKDHADD